MREFGCRMDEEASARVRKRAASVGAQKADSRNGSRHSCWDVAHAHVATDHVATLLAAEATHAAAQSSATHRTTHLTTAQMAGGGVATTSSSTVATTGHLLLLLAHSAASHWLLPTLGLGDESRGAGIPTLLRLWQSHATLKALIIVPIHSSSQAPLQLSFRHARSGAHT